MGRYVQSKAFAWSAFILVIIILIFTFAARAAWWSFFDIFFGFMMVFCHLIAVYSRARLPYVGKQMDTIAAVFGILAILALIAEYIVWNIVYKL